MSKEPKKKTNNGPLKINIPFGEVFKVIKTDRDKRLEERKKKGTS